MGHGVPLDPGTARSRLTDRLRVHQGRPGTVPVGPPWSGCGQVGVRAMLGPWHVASSASPDRRAPARRRTPSGWSPRRGAGGVPAHGRLPPGRRGPAPPRPARPQGRARDLRRLGVRRPAGEGADRGRDGVGTRVRARAGAAPGRRDRDRARGGARGDRGQLPAARPPRVAGGAGGLDEVWFLDVPDAVRRPAGGPPHAYGKTPAEAEAWVARVDDATPPRPRALAGRPPGDPDEADRGKDPDLGSG